MDLSKPLAYRMRPKSLEEFVGQEHVVGKDKLLYRTIKADRLSSLILWGPPGCGKTSLAKVISETTKYKFYKKKGMIKCEFGYTQDSLEMMTRSRTR
mgnify:CR=1 FL=1